MRAGADCVVAGAGAVGLAVARAFARGGREVLVLESAAAVGTGASSRNSEVIHAGIYYKTGSLKARLCVAGKGALYAYLAERDLAHRRLGKIIVAVTAEEIPALESYHAQAETNGVNDLQWLSAADVARLEAAVTGVCGLLSPSTGILDTHEYLLALQGDLEAAGGLVVLGTPVERATVTSRGFQVQCGGAEPLAIDCDVFVNAAGLRAPDLAGRIDALPPAQVPTAYLAKGHYYALAGASPFSRLVYPLPERGGLGVHATLDMSGAARFGPDVTWVTAEDYSFDDSRRPDFIDAIRRYYPALDESRLQPGYTGIRPKLAGPAEGDADFVIQGPAVHGVPGLVNLFGIESPGMTASLAIGEHVRALLEA
jgi:L-2-hydroxyglutarate oxidase LhgO